MTYDEACEMYRLLKHAGTFSRLELRQVGGEFAEAAAPWTVELWSINPKSGNMNLTSVEEYHPEAAEAIARHAMGSIRRRVQSRLRHKHFGN